MGVQGSLECDHCHNKFKDKYNLTRHHVAVDRALPPRDTHPCTQCDKTFTRGDNLRQHVKRHTIAQQFPCSDCIKIYASKSKLKLHMAKAHGDGETSVFKCSHCEHESENNWNLGQHMQRHTGEWAFACDDCRYKTSTKINLDKHVNVQHGPRPRHEFPCDQCDYSTPRKYNLNAHKRKHADVRPFSCQQCDQTFKHKYQLPIHYRLHSGERLLRCEPCDKFFVTRQLMKKHEKSISHRLDPEQQIQQRQLLQELKDVITKMHGLGAFCHCPYEEGYPLPPITESGLPKS